MTLRVIQDHRVIQDQNYRLSNISVLTCFVRSFSAALEGPRNLSCRQVTAQCIYIIY